MNLVNRWFANHHGSDDVAGWLDVVILNKQLHRVGGVSDNFQLLGPDEFAEGWWIPRFSSFEGLVCLP